jgi:hypothetical protein
MIAEASTIDLDRAIEELLESDPTAQRIDEAAV